MAKTKNKRTNLADSYAKIRKQRQQTKKTLTPFEVHVNKDKQKVLGRKNKADQGLPGIARSKAITKRKNTLLVEYKVKDKDNIFLDKRIGEKNSGMTQEDKAMARFAAERVKAHSKKNIFNLNDEEVLTHRGQSLIDIEKYDDPKSDDDDYSDDENKTGKLGKHFVEDAHFGGGVLSKPDSEMSRKDLIDQLIAESKKRKAERQKIREQTIDLTEKLDSEWRDLLPLVSSSNKKIEVVEEKHKVDDYDKAMRELKFEARGTPSDKLKSEEEIAKGEKLKLEKLEQDRLARMQGFSNEAEFQSRHRSADDLDDFQIEKIEELSDDENEEQKGILKKNDDQDNEEDSNEEDNENDEETNEGSDEGDDGLETEDPEKETVGDESDEESGEESEDDLSDLKASDLSEDETENEIIDSLKVTNKEKTPQKIEKKKLIDKSSDLNQVEKILEIKETKIDNEIPNEEEFGNIVNTKERDALLKKARKELPYTYKAPENYEELQSLFKDQSPIHQSIIVERIIKCYHWKLAEKNKGKLLTLFSLLLQYIENCSTVNSPSELTEFFLIFDRLCPHFYDLTQANPDGTRKCLQEILKERHSQFENKIKVYPDLYTLILFKLVSILYPTSDFRHPIVTPCLVFMSQVLLRCKLKRKKDISKGLFVCTLILEYTSLSKRWSPSVINFLRGILYVSLPKPFPKLIKVIPPFKQVGNESNILVLEENHKQSEIDPVNLKMQVKDLIESEIDDDYRIRTFMTVIHLLLEFQEKWSELDAVYSIFEPILTLLKCGSIKRYPKPVKEKVKLLVNNLEKLKEKRLDYLTFEKKKPKGIRMLEPRIEVVHDGKKHKPMSKVKAEREKLLHKLKKEKKSAVREIRRDNAFISKIKIKQQIASDTERKRKVKEIFADAAIQQSELKKFKKK